MKKKTRADLLEQRAKLVAQRNAIIKKSEKAQRKLTATEMGKAQSLATEIIKIDAQLDKRKMELYTSQRPASNIEKDAMALRDILLGKDTDVARALLEEGARLNRSAGISVSNGYQLPFLRADLTATNNGTELIQTDKSNVLAPLLPRLVLHEAGATFLSGLTGNLEIPNYSGTTANWAGETDKSTDGAGTFSSVKMMPKRLTTKVTISEQLLIQDSVGAYNMLMNSIYDAIAQKLEKTILGAEAGDANKPAGLFNGTIADKGKISFGRLTSFEEALESNGLSLNKATYVTSAKGKSILRSTLKDPKTGAGAFLTDGADINGIKLLSTSNVAGGLNTDEEGLLLGDFSNLIVGQWGGLNILVDPYSKSDQATIQIVVNAWFDSAVQREGSIVKASFKA